MWSIGNCGEGRIHLDAARGNGEHRQAAPVTGRVDLHAHILPGFDDGANRDSPLDLVRAAAADGTAVIVATPHTSFGAKPARVREAVSLLRQQTTEAGIAVDILAGLEVLYSDDLVARYQNGDLLTLNGTRYLLVECDVHAADLPEKLIPTLIALRAAGAWPIFAHVERYVVVRRNPSLLLPLIAAGIPLQVNADAFTGRAGESPPWYLLNAVHTLLRRRMVHLIASDTHSIRQRPPFLRAAFEKAATIAGADEAARIAANAWAVVRGEPVALPQPEAE